MRFLQKIKKKYILGAVLLIAIFLRFWNLTNVPPSASLDEVSIGYNAFSILKTGRDEYGTMFPVLLRAYDDWRPALYVYLVIPFVKILGLSVLAVRFPSVLLSILTVISTYFLVKELFKNNQLKWLNVEHFALLSTFLLAISPWHIYISRLGHEVNAGFAFFIFGLLFFLKERFGFSILFFLLSFISYQSEKIFIPLFLIVLMVLYRKTLLQKIKKMIIPLLISLIILTPFIKETLSPNALVRLHATNIFSAEHHRFEEGARRLLISKQNNGLMGQIINNRRIVATQIVVEGYVSHFNPYWLFTNKNTESHKVPRMGLLYAWELPFILLGITLFLTLKFDVRIKVILILWFLLSPVSSSFTTDAPHAMRSFTFLPTWQIFSSLGLLFFFAKIPRVVKSLFVGVICVLILYSLYSLYINYFILFSRQQSRSFQLALSKAVSFVENHEKQYNNIIFSNVDNLYQSYMFFLFYSKYDPQLYLSQGGTKSGGFKETHYFGKYEFREINWSKEKKDEKTLFIGNPNDFPISTKQIFIGSYLDGTKGIIVVRQ